MKILFECLVGSRLYGINNENSDFDYKGFSIPTLDNYFGLKNFEQQITKDELTKTEIVIYSLSKYFKLCLKGNPTVLETAFVNEKFITQETDLGKEIRKFIRENLITKNIFKAYSAYFRAQQRKLERPDRCGKRQNLIDEFGFDGKFAAHAYRLGIQCLQVMKYGVIFPTLSSGPKSVCLSIRHYKLKKEEVIKLLGDIDKKMYTAYQKSSLSESPNFNKINDWLSEIHSVYFFPVLQKHKNLGLYINE